MARYLIYTRVSERGSGWTGDTSCEAQADECRRYLSAIDPAAAFEHVSDEFISGRTNERPQLRKLLSAAKDGTADWDSLAVIDLDRLSRSLEGWLEIAKALTSAGKGLVSVRQHIDFATPQGRFMMSMFCLMAEYFASAGAQKVRDKMLHIARGGGWPTGSVPLGYRRTAKKDNRLVVDPAGAEQVRAIFNGFLDGKGPNVLAKRLGLTPNRVLWVLRNRIYLGLVCYGGEEHPGAHPPLVTQTDYDAAQKLLPGRRGARRPLRQTYPYLLAGLIRCACGHPMKASMGRGHGGAYPYYRSGHHGCCCQQRQVRADALDDAVLQLVRDTAYSPAACAQLAIESEQRRREEESGAEVSTQDLRATIADLESRIPRVRATLEECDGLPHAHRAQLARLDELERQLAEARRDLADRLKVLSAIGPEDAAAMAAAWRTLAESMAAGTTTADERRAWLAAHVKRVAATPDGAFRVSYLLMYPIPEGSANRKDWRTRPFVAELSMPRPIPRDARRLTPA